VHAPNSQLGRVTGAVSQGVDVGDDFRGACGVGSDVVRKLSEILQEGVVVTGEAHPMSSGCFVLQSLLERRKQTNIRGD
jgi:hypothetical protein